jgi:glutamyl-tRNA synthetase
VSGYRGRFAPSPTGALHLGLARTALLAWLRARSLGGSFVIRVEDIDTPRVLPGSAAQILDELRFLGLDWDEGPDVGGPFGPYVQSERYDRYRAALAELSARGLVYRCSCTRKELALASAPHGPSEFGPPYPGTCRSGPLRPDAPCALRFLCPDPPPPFVDGLSGALVAPEARGDFVVARADGVVSYQLAVVLDDVAMGITEVVRGDDLSGCTGWQLALYDALGAARPDFVHVPLLRGPDGKRLAKRDRATSLAELRAQGRSAESLLGELAHGVGLTDSAAPIAARELVSAFSLAKLRAAAQNSPRSAE